MILVSYLLEKKFSNIVGASQQKGANILGFRGLISISVLAFHFVGAYQDIFVDEFITYTGFFSFFCVFLGYFFGLKIFDKSREIDWLKLYESRFWRLVPMHTFVVVIYVFSAMLHREGIKESFYVVTIKIVKWLTMGIWDLPHIGSLNKVFIGTNWTLKYDIIFYMFLPLLYLILRRKKISSYVLIIPLIAMFLSMRISNIHNFIISLYFLGGLFIAYLYKHNIHTYIHTYKGERIVC